MHVFKALAICYEPAQDRIVAVVNPGALDSWSFWLTRRLVLALLGSVPQELAKTSPLAKHAPAGVRSDLVAFEKEAAIAGTANAMSSTPPDIMWLNAAAAELAVKLTLIDQGDSYRLEIHGEHGGHAGGNLQRTGLQRILQMIEDEAGRGQWLTGFVAASSVVDAPAPAPKLVRH